MQAVVSGAMRTLFSLPLELLTSVVQRVRPKDVDSLAKTCRNLFTFVNSSGFIDTYLRENSPLPAPARVPSVTSLMRPSATRPELMRARSASLRPREQRKCSIAALQAGELLGARPKKMTPIGWGQSLGPSDYCAVSAGWPNKAFIAKEKRREDGAVESLVFVLPEDMGYSTLALGALGFPPASVDEARIFRLYRVEDSLVCVCASGGDAWLYLIVPRRYGFHQITDSTLTPHVLAKVSLTAHEMKPIAWAGKARAVLAWGDGVPELWAIADPQ